MKKIKVIYISGIGRSGSTLLDMLISTNSKVFSVGEIYKYNELIKKNTKCACGKKVKDCDFWSKIPTKKSIQIFNHMNTKDYLKVINYLFNPCKNSINFEEYSDNKKLLNKIINNAPDEVEYILDSSKEIGRLIELNKDPNIEVYNIWITRDGRGVANSFNSKRQNEKEKNFYISILKWIFMNMLINKYINKTKLKSIQISYDEFCKSPDKFLSKIEEFLSIEIPNDYIKKVRSMRYHNLGGNRLAERRKRKKFSGIKYDEKWKYEQPVSNKLFSSALTCFFNKLWVY